jgi:UDP-N-acetylmuramoyl-L-alanyl-D-glutamate--2,6-diaminopimelate ligase
VKLRELLHGLNLTASTGSLDIDITGIVSDNREIEPSNVFVCYQGISVDSHIFVADALQKGAAAIIGEKPVTALEIPTIPVTYVQVPNGRRAMSLLAANWHGNPAKHLKLIGITGTNGKTSTAHLIHTILKSSGRKTALIGTIGHQYTNTQGEVKTLPASLTTPDAFALHALFKQFVADEVEYVTMETSSQGLALQRLAGLVFDTAVFTNFTQDHLDYHQTMEEYLQAKMMLFQQLNPDNGLAILNADDRASDSIRHQTNPPSLTFGIEHPADLTVCSVESTLKGLSLVADTPRGKISANLRLLGDYNLYNALAAIGIGLHHNCSLEAIQAGLESTVVPGRFELVDRGQPFAVVVDYAHTPDGLENLLTAARKITQGNLICVFGCGGDRDRGKRPKMGNISATIADHSMITSDNPRTEEPDAIIGDIMEGLPDGASYDLIQDRRTAIGHAIELAKAGDLVTIAGKGHEPYQEINGVRFDFDDREVAAEFLEQLK